MTSRASLLALLAVVLLIRSPAGPEVLKDQERAGRIADVSASAEQDVLRLTNSDGGKVAELPEEDSPRTGLPSDAVRSGAESSVTSAHVAGLLSRSPAPVRVPRPVVPPGPRRVGLQVGHWRTDEVPDELRRLEHQTGTSGGGVAEWQLNLDIANRVASMLRGYGLVVDVLPTAVPPGYLADAFVALHADGDADGSGRGYKAAHGSRRGPFEDQLVRALMEEYGQMTGLAIDAKVSRNMLGYYAFSWTRFQSAAAPHTPAAILEMGFLTNASDRTILLQRPDTVARGIANGVLRFLDEVPAGVAFAEDLLVPPAQPFGLPRPQA